MSTLIQNIKFSTRTLLKTPAFTLIAILTLALGIGANTTIFSAVNALLLRPLPFPDPDRLVLAWQAHPQRGLSGAVSWADFEDWRDRNHVFSHIAAFRNDSANLTGSGEPARIRGARVSASTFSLLGVQPALGRSFTPEEDRPDGPRAVIISHGLWQRRFGANPQILGASLMLDGQDRTVIGVMPPGFNFPERDIELWRPHQLDRNRAGRGTQFLQVIARMKPGVTLQQARTEMAAIARQIEQEEPANNSGWTAEVVSLREQLVGDTRDGSFILLAVVGFVLLIACANIANLFLARAAARHRELAIRRALGAGRARMVGQLLTESTLLSLAGGVLGLLLSLWGTEVLSRMIPEDVYRTGEINLDLTVLLFTLALSLFTGVLFGIAPALHASRFNLSDALKESERAAGGGLRRNRLRGALLVTEVALAIVLLIGAGLMVQSFLHLLRVNPGFTAENVLVADVILPRVRYPENPQRVAFFTQALERIAALPGVESAAGVNHSPFSGSNTNSAFTVESHQLPPGQQVYTRYRTITPDYFRALSIPVRRGRTFTDRDNSSAPFVAIINDAMAEKFWPGENPLGRRFKFGTRADSDAPWNEVVGVVGNITHSNLAGASAPEVYVPFAQNPSNAMNLVLRANKNPESLGAAVRSSVLSVDPNQPVASIRTLTESVRLSVRSEENFAQLLGAFSFLALLLTTIGIYGVMSYLVTQRTHEIGIRMAVGALPRDVLSLVLRQGMLLAGLGIVIGLVGARFLSRVMQDFLYGIKPTDAITYVAVAVIVAAVALAALFLPARRATRTDPLTALRYE